MLLPQVSLSWLWKERNAQLLLFFLSSFPSRYLVFLLGSLWQELTLQPASALQVGFSKSWLCGTIFFNGLSYLNLSSAFSTSDLLFEALPFLLSPRALTVSEDKGGAGQCQLAQIWLLNLPWNKICPETEFWGDELIPEFPQQKWELTPTFSSD